MTDNEKYMDYGDIHDLPGDAADPYAAEWIDQEEMKALKIELPF